MKIGQLLVFLLTSLAIIHGNCWATNGYFQHGIGVKEQGMGGAAIAFPQSTMSAATNPATLTGIGNRLDLGLDWFNPTRSAAGNSSDTIHKSGSTNFLIPQFGFSHKHGKTLSLGLIVYANGGMQTDWKTNFFGSTSTYSNLEQSVIAPTIAYKVSPNHSFGISINYIQQAFEARGLEGFSNETLSTSMTHLSDQGKDKSTGWGARLGYFGKLTDGISIGMFWQPETRMEKFSSYRGLLAEQGKMNIPETYGIGLALKLNQTINLAADLTTIKYSEISALGNRNNIGSALLGDNNGPGFGWRDVTVLKLGIAYNFKPTMTFRAGWNHSNSPIRNSETTFNILSPATITDHFTFGASWLFEKNKELSVSYWYGTGKESKGDATASNDADDARLKMHQNNVGIAYSWLF